MHIPTDLLKAEGHHGEVELCAGSQRIYRCEAGDDTVFLSLFGGAI